MYMKPDNWNGSDYQGDNYALVSAITEHKTKDVYIDKSIHKLERTKYYADA